jgi:FMN phosphatase YigB (HAD superfamily)
VVSDTGFDLRPALDLLGLSPLLGTVVVPFEHGACKPATALFQVACDRLQVDPARNLLVGDNLLTDSGAVAAGMYAFVLPQPAKTGPRGLATSRH